MFRLVHALSNIVVANDLAVGMVLVGRSELRRKLQRPRERALRSRIGFHVRLDSAQLQAA